MADAVFPWEKDRATGKRKGGAAVVPEHVVVPFPVAQEVKRTRDGRTRPGTYLWARRCPGCGKVRVFRARRRTCSKRCGNVLADFRASKALAFKRRHSRMRKLALRSRLENQQARVDALIAGMTPREVYQFAYRRGYIAGHQAGRTGCKPLDRSIA